MPSHQDSTTVRAVCILRGVDASSIHGTIHFAQMIGVDQMKVTGELRGLPVDRKLAIHVHEFGDLTAGPTSTGARFNPDGRVASPSNDPTVHRIHAAPLHINPDGHAKIDCIDPSLTLFGPSSIIGRSVVLTDEKDEEQHHRRIETDETKASNASTANRLAAGVIGICQ